MNKKNLIVNNLNMRKINIIFQEILKFVLLFLLSFIWLRYFIRKLWLATLISLMLSILLYAFLLFFKKRKQNQNGLKIKEKEEAKNMFLSLACDENALEFFVKLAKLKHENVIKRKDFIVITHNSNKTTKLENPSTSKQKTDTQTDVKSSSQNLQRNTQKPIEIKPAKTLLYVDLSFEGLSIPRFMTIYNKVKKEKATKIVIVCKSISDKQLSAFCQNFQEKFLILDEYQTYQKLYKYYDCFPEITHRYNTKKQLAFKDFIAYSFNKKRTKGYLFSAFVLILSGLFIRTTIYYCIIASLLVVFALISQFNPYFNTKGETEVL